MKGNRIQTTKGNAEQTAELLREKIRNGEISNEGKIPSIRKLTDLPGFGDRNAIWRTLGNGTTGPSGSACSYVTPIRTFALTTGL